MFTRSQSSRHSMYSKDGVWEIKLEKISLEDTKVEDFEKKIINTPFNYDSLDTETVDTFILNNFEADEIAFLFSSSELSETNFIDYNLNDETLDYYLESLDETELILE